MTGADGLMEFLTARLDEDEQAAAAARSPIGGGAWWRAQIFAAAGAPPLSAPVVHSHIVRHSPERVLADIAAKRNLIAVMAVMLAPMPTPAGYPDAARKLKLEVELAEENAAKLTLRLLAQPYRDHPDWRQEWAA